MSESMGDPDAWYWDLNKQRAVRASERGPGSDTLGPYASKFEAENWQAKVEERNEEWEDADEQWDDPDGESEN